MRVAFANLVWNTGASSPGEELMTRSTRSRVRRASSVFWAAARVRRCNLDAAPRFGTSALRRRALAFLLFSLDRRAMAGPKAQDPNYVAITPGICGGRNGVHRPFCSATTLSPYVRFGSLADIEAPPRKVRFTPKADMHPRSATRLAADLILQGAVVRAVPAEAAAVTGN
jgi:hypothetical protein